MNEFVFIQNLFVLARKKKELPVFEQVEITDIAAEGKAVARVNDLVVFIPYGAPGDIVDLQIYRKKHKYAEGRVIKTHVSSPIRVVPFCEHFGVCGGCKWQHIPYEYQLKYKQKQVFDNLTRIGKIPLPEFDPIKGSVHTEFYRNKLEFTFSNKSWLTTEQLASADEYTDRNALGFHIPGMFDKVLDIKKCWLQDDISNRIRLAVKRFALDNNYPFFDLREQTGLMRNIIVRTASTGEIMLIVVFFEDDTERIQAMMDFIAGEFPQIHFAVVYCQSPRPTIRLPIKRYMSSGDVIIFSKRWDGLRFKIGPEIVLSDQFGPSL